MNWRLQELCHVKYWKVSHFVFTITFVFEMFITGVYWCALFPYTVVQSRGQITSLDITNSVMAHAVPITLLSIDFQFNLVVVWNFVYIPFYIAVLILYLLTNCLYTLEV